MAKNTSMTRAAIYVRISQDRSEEGLGVARQHEDCLKWAQSYGVSVAQVYEDNDMSAYSGKPRPAYRRLCDDLKGGVVDGVIVWHADRLHRSPRELEDFIDILQATGAGYHSVTGGNYDLSTSDGRMVARMLGSVAKKESEDKSRRIIRKHEELAERGLPGGGGARGYGYTAQYELIPDEAAIIEELTERVIAGEPLRSLCRDLDDRGVQTVKGAPWTTTTIKDVLLAPRIVGMREHKGVVVGKAVWPAIITTQQQARLRAILTDPARRNERPARSYFLSGIVTCGNCGHPMIGSARSKGNGRIRKYVCAKGNGKLGCGTRAITSEPLEVFILAAMLDALDSAEMSKASAQDGDNAVAHLTRAIEGDLVQLDELATMYANKELTAREWSTAKGPITRRITDNEKRLAAAAGDAVGGLSAKELRKEWEGHPTMRRRAIVGTLIESIEVGPASNVGPRFDEGRIIVKWKA